MLLLRINDFYLSQIKGSVFLVTSLSKHNIQSHQGHFTNTEHSYSDKLSFNPLFLFRSMPIQPLSAEFPSGNDLRDSLEI